MTEWSVSIDAAGPANPDEDLADHLVEALASHHVAVSVGNGYVSARLDVTAETEAEGITHARELLRAALAAVGHDLQVLAVSAQTVLEQEKQLAQSNVPELLGVAEVAEALGVSKQRVSELEESERFPAPLVRLRAGPIWSRTAIARFLRDWERRPGPRRRREAESASRRKSA